MAEDNVTLEDARRALSDSGEVLYTKSYMQRCLSVAIAALQAEALRNSAHRAEIEYWRKHHAADINIKEMIDDKSHGERIAALRLKAVSHG